MDKQWNGTPVGFKLTQAEGTVSETSNALEVLRNVTYLTAAEANRPDRVRMYMGIADEQLQSLADLLLKHM